MRNRFVKLGVAGAVALVAVLALAGCTPSTIIRTMVHAGDGGAGAVGTPYDEGSGESRSGDAGYSESGFEPVQVSGPVDWQTLQPCDDASGGYPWVLVSTFPADEIDNADIAPFCGDTFISDENDDDNFVGAVATTTQYEIFLLGGKLVSAGWVLASDDFDATPYEGTGVYVGAREYTRDDTSLLISAYDNGVHPASLTVFLDYYSPETRALGNSQT